MDIESSCSVVTAKKNHQQSSSFGSDLWPGHSQNMSINRREESELSPWLYAGILTNLLPDSHSIISLVESLIVWNTIVSIDKAVLVSSV